MSHITKVKSKINNLIHLEKALKDLKLQLILPDNGQTLKIKGFNGEYSEDNLKAVIQTGTPYQIGVIYNEEDQCYEFASDWWGIETYFEKKQTEWMNQLNQRYAYHSIMDKIREKGYEFVNETTDENQAIRLTVRKWS